MTKERTPLPALLPNEQYAGKNIVLSGTTGFVGKVVLAQLLDRYPDIGCIYPLIRPGASDKARDRFDKSVATSPAMAPLRKKYGDDYLEFLNSKVIPIDGNITRENCGISDETLEMLERTGVDLIVNSAGLVDFDPPIDQALAINALGAQNVVAIARRFEAAVVHVSTCFVAGIRSGQVLESEPIVDQVPPGFEARGAVFDHLKEIERCGQLASQVRGQADDPYLVAQWHEQARDFLRKEGRDPDNPVTLRAGVTRQKKIWLAEELKRVGMERSKFWGWTNTYTFTKALGEMVIAKAVDEGLNATIVRPSIVESALEFPLPGWNEGFTTTAPLILMVRRGILNFPYSEDLILDVVPCDMVSSVIIGAGAAAIEGTARLVYHASTGDQNPLTIKQAIELTAFHSRNIARDKQASGLMEFWKRNNETVPVTADTFKRFSIPRFKQIAEQVLDGLDKVGVDRFVWARQPAAAVQDFAEDVKKSGDQIDKVLDLFLPFVAENFYVFRAEHSRELMARMPDEQRLNYDPNRFRWRDYYLNVHVPGLERWVFPRLEEELEDKPKHLYMYRDLGELFESTCHSHRHKTAFEYLLEDGGIERLTFGEMHRLSRRVGAYVKANGAGREARVALMGENRPEWAPCYFGILQAGCTVVPIDQGATPDEVQNILNAGEVTGLIVTPKVLSRLKDDGLNVAALPIWPMADALCHREELPSAERPAPVASLIFTSGTTGKPKGVQLSHRNFTFEVSRLGGIFKLNEHDHLLSVLPLHHTFEFTAGFLLPVSRGAKITYLETLDGDSLSRALASGVSGLIGVPALWQLLQRRIESRLGDGALGSLVLEGIKQTNLFLRDRAGLNVGTFAAFPIHQALGGRLKYLVSGGSALDPEVMTFFRGLGFNMTEGYGLTETSPVLTVTDPKEKVIAGSVGRPIHGVEIRIDGANDEGVGEVLARGPNVMMGYFGDESANESVFVDGWFRTGDLGRLDEDGRLFIVGRQKDVIVDGDGRNVYPDEIEELYGKHARIKEISVVGLDQGGAEKVAALVVPENDGGSRGEIRRTIEEHFKETSESLPFHKRVKILEVWDGELPRTAKRSVKRGDVAKILERLVTAGRATETPVVAGELWPKVRDIVSGLTGTPAASLSPEMRINSDLSFDSLTFVELTSQLERLAGHDIDTEALMKVERIGDITKLLRPWRGTKSVALVKAASEPSGDDDGLVLPRPVQNLGRRLLTWGQRQFYDRVMDVDVRGLNCAPHDSTFLVASNHASHLDAGLIKTSLGERGKNLVALAARDYFWGSPIVKAYTTNFTQLVPIERHGAVKQSMRRALNVLEGGDSLLLFPEGTRSENGEMREFKTSVGYLAQASGKPVLPAYIWGTYEAMPKGSTLLPKERAIGIAFGPPIRPEHLASMLEGRPRRDGHRIITRMVELAVLRLRDGGTYRVSELLEQVKDEYPVAAPDAAEPDVDGAGVQPKRSVRRRAGRRRTSGARARRPRDER
ncbi:MAG: AMP-binding protein [Myxococcota bacterium]